MSVFIGDLMAGADDGGGAGGRKRKRKRGAGKKKKETRGVDDKSGRERSRGDDESRFLTGPSAQFGMTRRWDAQKRDSLRPEFLRKEKGLAPERGGGVLGGGF